MRKYRRSSAPTTVVLLASSFPNQVMVTLTLVPANHITVNLLSNYSYPAWSNYSFYHKIIISQTI